MKRLRKPWITARYNVLLVKSLKSNGLNKFIFLRFNAIY